MQRVLSFQMGRGFGEPSEFVTKRMCFSFLISVAFLSILCGFLIGKFSTGRVFEIRAEKLRMEMNGNGLEKNDFIRNELIQRLKEDFNASAYVADLTNNKALESVEKSLSGLNIFNKVTGNDSCVIATVHGSHEPDRYVALAANGESITVAVPIARELQRIYQDHSWVPRRSLIFLMSSGSMESCLYFLSNYEISKIIAYIAIDNKAMEGDGFFLTSGSDIVHTTIREASANYLSFKSHADTAILPRLNVAIPQARVAFFVHENGTREENFSHKSSVAQVLGTSLWRLSEMTIAQWDPELLNEVIQLFNRLELSRQQDYKTTIEKIKTTIEKIINAGKLLNEKIDKMDTMQSLNVRIMNDFLKGLELALLCPDEISQSKTDMATLRHLSENGHNVNNYLHDMLICFENADKILQDMT